MELNSSFVYHNLYRVHLNTLPITQPLVLNKCNEFHHFAMRLYLSHVFLDGKLLTAEQPALLSLVDVEASERVYE